MIQPLTFLDAARTRLRQFPYWREAAGVLVVLVLALALRVVRLDSIPTNITADEADNLSTVFRIDEAGEPGPFGLDWKPQPAMSAYLFLGSMEVFGKTIFGMRMASAVLSTLAIIPFYLLARQVVRPVPAIGGAALLATGQWYLHFSRSGWENVHVALYALLAALAISLALRRGQYRWYVLAGVACALGLYGYFAGRMIVVALLLYAPLALWWARGMRRTVVIGFTLMLGTCLLFFVPQVPSIAGNWDEFNKRTSKVYVLNEPRPYHGETTDIGVLREQLSQNVRGFFLLDGDEFKRGRYGPVGEPLYDRVTGALFLAGMVLSLRRFRKTALWWFLLLVPLLVTQIPTTKTPDGARALIVAPFIYLFIAVTFDELVTVVRRIAPVLRKPVYVTLIVGVLVLGAWNVRSYFTWIQSPAAVEARQPAVPLEHYEFWRSALRQGIRAEGPDYVLDDWEERLEQQQ